MNVIQFETETKYLQVSRKARNKFEVRVEDFNATNGVVEITLTQGDLKRLIAGLGAFLVKGDNE